MARVVVVEDSPVTRQLLAAIVEAAGHELLAACDNGLDGLNAIQRFRPDVALLDMLLPQLDGVQVLQRLQALGVSVPVIMLSSVTSADRIQAARAAGVRHYLLKPFDAQKVMATLERVLTGGGLGTGPLTAPAAPGTPSPQGQPPSPGQAASGQAPVGQAPLGQSALGQPPAAAAGQAPTAPGPNMLGHTPGHHLQTAPVAGTSIPLVPQGGTGPLGVPPANLGQTPGQGQPATAVGVQTPGTVPNPALPQAAGQAAPAMPPVGPRSPLGPAASSLPGF